MPSAALLSLASNDAVKQIVIRYGFSKGLVQRFIAGETLEAALLATCRLQDQGLSVALDELGENGFTEYEAETAAQSYVHSLHALDAAQIPAPYLSVKLTALGLNLGTAVAAKNLGSLLSAAQRASPSGCPSFPSMAMPSVWRPVCSPSTNLCRLRRRRSPQHPPDWGATRQPMPVQPISRRRCSIWAPRSARRARLRVCCAPGVKPAPVGLPVLRSSCR